MKRMLLLSMVLLLSASAGGETPEDIFKRGNTAFESGAYENALSEYNALLEMGHATPAVHYNLGCTYFAANHLGEAVLAFERANLYSPRFGDLRHNLDVIRDDYLADHDIVTYRRGGLEGSIENLVNYLTGNEWLVMTSLLFWLCVASLWLRFMMSSPAWRLGLLYAFLSLSFCVLAGVACCSARIMQDQPGRHGIVLVDELQVQQSPSLGQNALFRLHPGTGVRIEDWRGSWLFVRIRNGAAGWAPASEIGIILPASDNSSGIDNK
jgi:hypothetical protein